MWDPDKHLWLLEQGMGTQEGTSQSKCNEFQMVGKQVMNAEPGGEGLHEAREGTAAWPGGASKGVA